MGFVKKLKKSSTKDVKKAMDAEVKKVEEIKQEVKEDIVVPVEIVKLEISETEPVDVLEYPVQTTFNTDDMSIVEDGE